MSLIDAKDLAKAFGAHDVLQGISLSVAHQARLALVGPNGVGKTTLLRILAGLDRADAGHVHRARHLSAGYLPQEMASVSMGRRELETALWDFALTAFADLRDAEARLSELETSMGDPQKAESAMARYGPLQESFEQEGGYTYRAETRRVLSGLGFSPSSFERSMGELSGGERTRAQLARLLLQDPDVLLLDEPTNHLDIQAIAWLESWLRDWPGAVVVVSHDRTFLDHAADYILEMTPTGIESYRGNYTAYVQQRSERLEYRMSVFERQQAEIERERAYIRKNIAGQNTRQAQGRRTRLERFIRDEAVERPGSRRTMRMDLGEAARSGDLVIETTDLQVGHADASGPLFTVPDLTLVRGECAAVIGPNGAGKTTLLKTLLGSIQPWSGQAKLGAGVKIGYFAQAHEDLDPSLTVLDSVLAAGKGLKLSEARDFLGGYLFSGDQVDELVGALSGGERGRLALALLALAGANILLLDEPTNHLDLPSQEVLQQALETFGGTILLVSHDRYLIRGLATQVWEVSPEENRLTVFKGGYDEYVEAAARESDAGRSPGPAASRRARSAEGREISQSDRRRLESLESDIESMESDLADLADAISGAGEDHERVTDLGRRYADLERELEAALAAWEELVRGQSGA